MYQNSFIQSIKKTLKHYSFSSLLENLSLHFRQEQKLQKIYVRVNKSRTRIF